MPRPIRCILLIDDDPDDVFIHRLVIEESGLCDDVREATTGAEALRYLTQPDRVAYPFPDLMLLDVNLPGMNGFEFLQEYRRWVPNPPVSPVVVVFTTSLNPVERERAETFDGVSGYHVKPLTTSLLYRLVEKHFTS